MSFEKQQGDSHNRSRFLKVLFLALLVLGVLFYFYSLLSWQILALITTFPLLFFFFRDRLWILLSLAVPALLAGKVFYFQVGSNWIYEASLTEVLLLVSFLIFAWDHFLNQKREEIRVDKLSLLLFIYLMVAVLSFYHIVDFRYFVVGLKVLVFSFISYFLAVNSFRNWVSIKRFLQSLALFVIILSFQVFWKFYQMGFSSKFFFERSSIIISLGPVALVSAVLAFLLPLLLAWFFWYRKWKKEKIFVLLAFLAGGVAVFLSLGKAAIFSAGLGLVYLFIKLRRKRVFFVLAGAGFLVFAFVFFHSFFTGLLERISRTFISQNTQFRITEYQVGWQIIKDNFLLGVGAGQQLAYYKQALNWNDPQLVNNFFLQAFIELGLVGLGLVLSAAVLVYQKIRNKMKSLRFSQTKILAYGFVAAFITCFFNGLAEVTLFALPYAVIFWLVLGVFNNMSKQTV